MAYREIYSWKAAILYRRFVCQGTPSFVALEKTGFFEESARAAYTSRKASSEFMLAMFDVVKIHTHQPATDNSFTSSTMLRNGGMTFPNMQTLGMPHLRIRLSLSLTKSLADGLATPLHLCMSRNPWDTQETSKVKW